MSRRPATLVTTTPASVYPINLEEAKLHLKVDIDEDDDLIQGLIIPAATSRAEAFLNRRLMTQTVELRMDSFPCGGFALLADPIQSVDSVKYYDANNVEQTLSLSAYETDLTPFAGWIRPVDSWPDTYDRLHAVRVSMTAGFASAEEIPQAIRQGLLLDIWHLYENRGAVNIGNIVTPIDLGYESLMWPFRIVPV